MDAGLKLWTRAEFASNYVSLEILKHEHTNERVQKETKLDVRKSVNCTVQVATDFSEFLFFLYFLIELCNYIYVIHIYIYLYKRNLLNYTRGASFIRLALPEC